MEAIALILTKFSDEVIAAQLALLFFTTSVALYWLVVRKKKKESAEWVPAALVRAYLDRVRADEQEVRFKLFGEAPVMGSVQAPLAAALSTVTTVTDPALLKEVDALRTQLVSSDQRAIEFDRVVNALKVEKAALEEKLKAVPAAGAVVAAPSPETLKELEDLKARLQEYEVIEDDLANLKKFQKENEQLKQKVEQYEKGGTVAAAAPTPEVTTIVSGDKPAAPAMTLVSGGAATPAAAPEPVAPAAPVAAAPEPVAAATPVAVAPAPAAPETNTNVLQEVAPVTEAPVTAAPAAAPEAAAAAPADGATAAVPAAEAASEKSAKQKEEELLSEFEKMLAS